MCRRFWSGRMHLNTRSVKHFLEWNHLMLRSGLGNYLVQLPLILYSRIMTLFSGGLVNPPWWSCMTPVCMVEIYFVASFYIFFPRYQSSSYLPNPKLISFSCSFELETGAETLEDALKVTTKGHESIRTWTWMCLTLETMYI